MASASGPLYRGCQLVARGGSHLHAITLAQASSATRSRWHALCSGPGPSMTFSLRLLLRCAPALVASVVALLLLFVPSLARAQTVTITSPTAMTMPPSLQRLDSSHTAIQKRSQSLNPEAINLSDCHNGQFIRFPLVIAGSGTGTLAGQVWATEGSNDCSKQLYREGTQSICYRLSSNFIVTPTQDVDVSVKELIKGFGDQSSSTDSQGCRLTTATQFTVWFLALSGTADAQGFLGVPITASTQGPAALSGIKALPGDTRITVSWDTVGEGGVTNVLGVQAYCDGPDPAAQGASDASTHQVCDSSTTATDAETGTGAEPTCTTVTDSTGAPGAPIPATSAIGSPGVACTTKNLPISGSTALIPDQTFDKFACGNVTGTGNTIVITDINGVALENGKVYAVAVAATDSYGNVGDVSSPVCQFPEQTSDFWRDYRNSGGGSGGGFCSVDGAGMPAGGFGLLVLGMSIGISAIRRRFKSRARRSSR